MHINMCITIFIYMHTQYVFYLFFVNFMNCFFIACVKLEYISKPTVKDSWSIIEENRYTARNLLLKC